MFCHLPIPYPDELLYSIIARFIQHIGTINHARVSDDVFGRRTKACMAMPGSLEAVAKRTSLVWGMTGQEIAYQLTLFPFYSCFSPSTRVSQCLTDLLSDNDAYTHVRLGLSARRIKAPRHLRFCKICRESDLEKYGETYWHRSHQLSGVIVCPEHGQSLLDTEALSSPVLYTGYADATLSTAAFAFADGDSLDEEETLKALKIAKRCQDFLLGRMGQWHSNDVTMAYRQAAIERGFIEGIASLSQTQTEAAFIAFYGETLLRKLGCEVIPGKVTSWIRDIFRPFHKQFHPTEHAMVQVFLESIPVDKSKKPFGLGPWKCPNPYVQHDEQFPIKKLEVLIGNTGKYYASVKCRCGFCFTFTRTSEADQLLPIVNNTHGLGPSWEAEAERLRQLGQTVCTIAKNMKISDETVKRLLRKHRVYSRPLPKELKEWRRNWLKLLNAVPNRSRNLARKQNERLYKKLWTYDKDWLLSEHRRGNHSPSTTKRADWTDRDQQWSRKLKASIPKIMATVPLRRVTQTSVIFEARLNLSVFHNLDRLPCCKSVLNEYQETLEDFRERRLKAVAADTIQCGGTLTRTTLLGKTGLHWKLLSPHLKAVIESLVTGINS